MRLFFIIFFIAFTFNSFSQSRRYADLDEFYLTYKIDNNKESSLSTKKIWCDTLLSNVEYSSMIGLLSCLRCYINLNDSTKIKSTIKKFSIDKLSVIYRDSFFNSYIDSSMINAIDLYVRSSNKSYDFELSKKYVLMFIEDQGRWTKERGFVLDDDHMQNIMNMGMGDLLDKARNIPGIEINSSNLLKIDSLFLAYGTPTVETIGVYGMKGVYLTILHGNLNHLERYDKFIKENYSPKRYAYLVDKKRVAKGNPQLFGTQSIFDKLKFEYVFYPIEDESHVDCRRMNAGLMPIKYYAKLLHIAQSQVPVQHDCDCRHVDE